MSRARRRCGRPAPGAAWAPSGAAGGAGAGGSCCCTLFDGDRAGQARCRFETCVKGGGRGGGGVGVGRGSGHAPVVAAFARLAERAAPPTNTHAAASAPSGAAAGLSGRPPRESVGLARRPPMPHSPRAARRAARRRLFPPRARPLAPPPPPGAPPRDGRLGDRRRLPARRHRGRGRRVGEGACGEAVAAARALRGRTPPLSH